MNKDQKFLALMTAFLMIVFCAGALAAFIVALWKFPSSLLTIAYHQQPFLFWSMIAITFSSVGVMVVINKQKVFPIVNSNTTSF